MDPLFLAGAAALGALVGLLIGWWGERLRLKRAKASAEDEALRIRAAATAESDSIRKAAELEGKPPEVALASGIRAGSGAVQTVGAQPQR